MKQMNIKKDKIIYESVKYVCDKFSLRNIHPIKDKVGIYAFKLADNMGRGWLFACKRYIDWSPKNYGRISFTKRLVELAIERNYKLIMLIEENNRKYAYTFNPKQILKTGYENEFNKQIMVNFDILLAQNMEVSRRKEIESMRVSLKEKTKPNQIDKSDIKITRFIEGR